MTFKSTKATPAGGKMWKVEGDLTLLGVTKPVTAMIEWIGFSEPRGKKLIGFEASFTITRSDFGMDYQVDQGGLGDEVSIIVGLEAVSS
jgi:polyisoprenoid-binding protein YceI